MSQETIQITPELTEQVLQSVIKMGINTFTNLINDELKYRIQTNELLTDEMKEIQVDKLREYESDLHTIGETLVTDLVNIIERITDEDLITLSEDCKSLISE